MRSCLAPFLASDDGPGCEMPVEDGGNLLEIGRLDEVPVEAGGNDGIPRCLMCGRKDCASARPSLPVFAASTV